MCAQAAPEEDRSVAMIRPSMPWRVESVRAVGFDLSVRFLDGTEGVVEMGPLIRSEQAGVFQQLADPAVFAQVRVEMGAVTWPGEIDIAPDAMYRAIKAHGRWVPN